jgi:hypothetical protein
LAKSKKANTGMKEALCCKEGKGEQTTRYKTVTGSAFQLPMEGSERFHA